MAINEQIVTGRKFRKLVDESTKLWQRISIWAKASDVEFNDGKTAEAKVGSINGVTDSLTSTSSNIAASAKAVKTLNDKITQLSSNIVDIKQLANSTTINNAYTYTFSNDYKNIICAAGCGVDCKYENHNTSANISFTGSTTPTQLVSRNNLYSDNNSGGLYIWKLQNVKKGDRVTISAYQTAVYSIISV